MELSLFVIFLNNVLQNFWIIIFGLFRILLLIIELFFFLLMKNFKSKNSD